MARNADTRDKSIEYHVFRRRLLLIYAVVREAVSRDCERIFFHRCKVFKMIQ